jgi:hypothetical protein
VYFSSFSLVSSWFVTEQIDVPVATTLGSEGSVSMASKHSSGGSSAYAACVWMRSQFMIGHALDNFFPQAILAGFVY